MVDTPGFDNPARSDIEILQEIAGWISAAYGNDRLLLGILYLHTITQTLMEGSATRNLMTLQNLCGQEVLNNVLPTTTHG